MTKTEPFSTAEQPTSPGSMTLPGRTVTDPVALPVAPALNTRALTAAEFQGLSDVPPELEWFANITNAKTRRAYQQDLKDFTAFVGISRPEEFRLVTRPHVIAWRKDLEQRNLALSTIRRKLAALSSLFEYLCEQNAVAHNPVDGVKRPKANSCSRLHSSEPMRAIIGGFLLRFSDSIFSTVLTLSATERTIIRLCSQTSSVCSHYVPLREPVLNGHPGGLQALP